MTAPASAVAAEIARLADTCAGRERVIAARLAALGHAPADDDGPARVARARARARAILAGDALGETAEDPGEDRERLAIERDALAILRTAAERAKGERPTLGTPPLVQDPPTLAEARAMVRRLPLADREALAPMFSASHLRAARTAERDAAILAWAAGRPGDISELARQLRTALSRYRAGQWRFEREQAASFDPRNRDLHHILQLSKGRVLAFNSLRKIIQR